jgi:hypothetical protein
MTIYQGSCHCGNVAYTVEGTIDKGMDCNCSICQRKGALLWFVPKTHFALTTPDENAGTYTFNHHHIRHRYCKACGIHPYAEGEMHGTPMAGINLRCLEGIDLDAVPVERFDGRSR